jgi:bifunctional DNA-binding transcriptional regulator/antitoxin component of YhaV-PrlF toxin-antitoxin module
MAGERELEHYGRANVAPNGQIVVPKGLREALGIQGSSTPVQIFGNRANREIVLIQEHADSPSAMADALRAVNRDLEP